MKDLTHRVETRTGELPRAYSKPGRLQKWRRLNARHAIARLLASARPP
jgi:hypothetical protein